MRLYLHLHPTKEVIFWVSNSHFKHPLLSTLLSFLQGFASGWPRNIDLDWLVWGIFLLLVLGDQNDAAASNTELLSTNPYPYGSLLAWLLNWNVPWHFKCHISKTEMSIYSPYIISNSLIFLGLVNGINDFPTVLVKYLSFIFDSSISLRLSEHPRSIYSNVLTPWESNHSLHPYWHYLGCG